MIKSSNEDTPFPLTYGTEAVIPAEIGMPTYRTAVVDIVRNDDEIRLNLDLLEERRERAAIREAKANNEASHAMDVGSSGTKMGKDLTMHDSDKSRSDKLKVLWT
ncbi:hypothetical protein Tco_1352208 [Tanacetum coccineum]